MPVRHKCLAWAVGDLGVPTVTCSLPPFSIPRIPFQLSQTVYKKELAVELAQRALKGLLVKTALDPAKVCLFMLE